MRLLIVLIALAATPASERLGGSPSEPVPAGQPAGTADRGSRISWRESVALGEPGAGRLLRGVKLPPRGRGYFTWDPILKRRPNRPWRRWASDHLLRMTLGVVRRFAGRFPGAPRIGIGDLSLPEGGYFGPEIGGGIGHATHQNGLDIDIYYPRLDRRERPPDSIDQIDMRLAGALVEMLVEAGAVRIFVGPSTGLSGPPGIVRPLVHHDNHLHARIAG